MAAITVGRGQKHPQGQRVELDSADLIASLGETIAHHTGVEAWWSGGVFVDNHRSIARWTEQQIIGFDVDYYDPLGQHAAVSTAACQVVCDALAQTPCAWGHLTPRGARLIVVLDAPIVDKLAYPRVWTAIAHRITAWIPKLPVGSLELDTSCRDLARYFWSPSATVGGIDRSISDFPPAAVAV